MSQSPIYRSDRIACIARTPPTSFPRVDCTWRSPVNDRLGRRWRCGGGFGGGSERIAVTRRQGERSLHAPVTATPWLSPRYNPSLLHHPPSPRRTMQNHPLSRTMGNYFLSVDYGVNFRTTGPDHFERDTTSVRDIGWEGVPWRGSHTPPPPPPSPRPFVSSPSAGK